MDGKQTITPADNAAQVPDNLDEEWFAVLKEQMLAEKCSEPSPSFPSSALRNSAVTGASGAAAPGPAAGKSKTTMASYFWTVMSQNGNAPSNLGTDAACIDQCYHLKDGVRPAGYPPAVNATTQECPVGGGERGGGELLGFSGLPMNQAKVMVGLTDPRDPALVGNINWTYELDADLNVPEHEFSMHKSLGIWSWQIDPISKKGVTRIYQRVSSSQ